MARVSFDLLHRGFRALGVTEGATLVVHSSVSAFGQVDGGAVTVLRALRAAVGQSGTVVVPAFTGDVIADPHPGCRTAGDPEVEAARARVPLFHDAFPTAMGAVPTAVLAEPERLRSRHPQASVAALGAAAEYITEHQPFAYALGPDSPFSRLYELKAQILLLGVGHNRNSFLHHAESMVPGHRTKLRRFPYLVEGQRVWLEAPDVGDDNDTHFPRVGTDWADQGQVSRQVIGAARCELVDAVPFIEFARKRLAELLCEVAGHPRK
ncbi:aminoglycoside N(3)-acetyltransferase [Lentzea sp. NPDC051213]|uniref:aminoglycoside N(3)-acetyltransferase n=1 Tax=Lentzea sp. NPDC051213 TaxID=3364126 RepID=UPI00378C22E9